MEILFYAGVMLAALGTGMWLGWWWRRREEPERRDPTRVVVWTRAPLSEEDLARVFREWPHDDERLAAVLQWLQAWLDDAQGEVVAARGKGQELNAAAGGVFWVETVLTDILYKIKK